MKPRIRRSWCQGFFYHVRIQGHYIWRCDGGGVEEGGLTAKQAYLNWEKAYRKPLRRFARWVEQLKKERA